MNKILFSFFAAFFMLNSGVLNAQNMKTISLEQLTVPVESATVTDSSAGGRMIYLATVEIGLRDNDYAAMVRNLLSGLTENRSMNISLRSTDLNGKITEERYYQGAVVQEIIFPELNGAGKNPVNVQIKIRSGSLSVKENAGNANAALGKRSSTAVESNFRVTLGGLLTNRVAKISAIRITAGQSSSFSLEVSETDAKSWQNWLMNAVSKRETGTIEWLAPTLKEAIFKVELRDVEITSITSQYNGMTEGRAIARLGVGLRGRITAGGK